MIIKSFIFLRRIRNIMLIRLDLHINIIIVKMKVVLYYLHIEE